VREQIIEPGRIPLQRPLTRPELSGQWPH
jgi:hypothetical protein